MTLKKTKTHLFMVFLRGETTGGSSDNRDDNRDWSGSKGGTKHELAEKVENAETSNAIADLFQIMDHDESGVLSPIEFCSGMFRACTKKTKP